MQDGNNRGNGKGLWKKRESEKFFIVFAQLFYKPSVKVKVA